MGRSRTPKYRVEMRASHMGRISFAYEKQAATPDGLVEFIKVFEKSFQPGGVNERFHRDDPVRVYQAEVINQKTNEVVCEFKLPMFQEI